MEFSKNETIITGWIYFKGVKKELVSVSETNDLAVLEIQYGCLFSTFIQSCSQVNIPSFQETEKDFNNANSYANTFYFLCIDQ